MIRIPILLALLLVPAAAQQVNTMAARLNMDFNGQLGWTPGPHQVNVPPGSILDIWIYSATSANVPIILGISPAAAPPLPTPGGQSVDIQLAGAEFHSSLFPGLLESFFHLNAAGYWSLSLPAPPVAGQSVAFQAAVVDPAASPAPDPVVLTSAYTVTSVVMQALTMHENWAVDYPLGWSFPFYGVPWGEVYIHANGLLTFYWPTLEVWKESETIMREGPPSINVFWDDLTPQNSQIHFPSLTYVGAGQILAVSDPVAQTFTCIWQNVAEYPTVGANSASVTLDATGTITVAYGSCTLQDAIAGVCPGFGWDPVLGAGARDLSACIGGPGCPASPPAYGSLFETFDGGGSVFDLSGLTLTYVPVGNGYRVH